MASQPVMDMNAYGQVDVTEAASVEYPPEFLSFLQSQEQDAVDADLDDQRATALAFYRGEPFGNEEEGRSQVVTRDVAEVVDYMTTSVARTMVSGDRIVEFEAVDSDAKDAVEQANEAVAQQFMRMQDGWRVIHDSLKAGLLEKTGAVKTFIEYKPVRRDVEAYEPRLAEMQEAGVEIVAADLIKGPVIDTDTGIAEPSLYRATIIERRQCFSDVPIPNEELLVARDARSLDEAVYYAHKVRKTVSELREMGITVDGQAIQYGDGSASTTLRDARDDRGGEHTTYRDGPNRICWLLEEYVRYDLNGDGIAELLLVQRVGTQIFTVKEIDFGLVEEWCPFPMQHRRVGQSLADKCMDIQLVRSILLRQSLDNLYLSNAPRTLVSETSLGDTTIDDLLSVRPGGIVRWSGSGAAPVPLETPFVAASSFEALEFMAGERESRTGITRMNQGLDQDALSKTATGQAMMQAAGQQIEEYVARNFAEFMARIFRKKYKLMRRDGEPFAIVIDGKPVMVDPKQWPEDIRVKVRVGLGSGRKEQRVQNRMLLLGLQKEAAMSEIPITNAMIFNSIDGLVRDLGLGVGTDYWPGPDTPEPEQGQDPEMLKAQAEMQIKAAEVEARKQEAALQLELKQQEAAAKIQLMREEASAKIELERQKAAAEAELAARQQDFEMAMAREQMALQREQAAHKADMDEQAVSKKRPGGDLDK